MTSPKNKEVEVLAVQRRRRWTASEKQSMVRQTYKPGMSMSLVVSPAPGRDPSLTPRLSDRLVY